MIVVFSLQSLERLISSSIWLGLEKEKEGGSFSTQAVKPVTQARTSPFNKSLLTLASFFPQ